jgi:hypothetical protein
MKKFPSSSDCAWSRAAAKVGGVPLAAATVAMEALEA